MHKKVQVVVLDQNQKQILLFKTSATRGAFIQNVTGSVEAGENYADAAVRELMEETGLSKANLKMELHELVLSFAFYDRQGLPVEERVFLARLKETPPPIKLDPKEHQSCEWTPLDKITPQTYGYLSNYQALLASCEFLKNHVN